MPGNRPYTRAELDQIAREQGFPSYEAWKAWNAKRNANLRKTPSTTTTTSAPPKKKAAEAPPKNWLSLIHI